MPTAEAYAWKSDVVRVTVVIVSVSAVLLLLDVVWPGTPTGFPRGPLAVGLVPFSIMLGRTAWSRDWLIVAAVVLPVSLVVLFVADQIRPLHSQPAWAYFFSTALAGWVGGVAAIWVTWLRVKRRQTQATASSSPLEQTPER